ncbi:hypothetical protein RchiOBHm_Chr2g0145951 [Rosa chinensis]|uniref:Uncharacterized protein n=1 Tax=Rosa chinensis TaxID=74649 RepID=A0A2P6RYS4_ROSCH|nr:hypothetical protein RchiOBHm_Chr2g0145951 [Rosa chinensis]
MWSLESRKQASRMVMEDDAHGNSSSPLALLEMLNALEDGEKMERKWRDKQDGMDEGIGMCVLEMVTKENGEEMVRQGDEMVSGIGIFFILFL